jgi:hypothetical protein
VAGVRWSEEDLAEFSRKRAGREADSKATAPARKPVQRPEQDLQRAVAEFLDLCLLPPARWLHIPNQVGTRDRYEAELLKAMGVKPGAADVLVLTGAGRFVWIELKSDAGRLSPAQQDWRDWCQSIGAPWFLCRSVADVVEALRSCQVRLRGALT